MRKKVVHLLIILIVLSLFGCSSAPGISTPLTINGIELQVISASLHKSYMIGSQEYSPSASGDLLLLVRAQLTSSGEDIDLGDWKAQVQDGNGRISNSDIQSKITGTIEGREGTFLEWFFVVDEDAQQLSLNIGEHEIDLSSILNKGSEE